MTAIAATKLPAKIVQQVDVARSLISSRFRLSPIAVSAMRHLFDCYLDVRPTHLQQSDLKRSEIASHWAIDELKKSYTEAQIEAASDELSDIYRLFKFSLGVAYEKMNSLPSKVNREARLLADAAEVMIPKSTADSLKAALMRLYLSTYSELDELSAFTPNGRRREYAAWEAWALEVALVKIKNEPSLAQLDIKTVKGAFKTARRHILLAKNEQAKNS